MPAGMLPVSRPHLQSTRSHGAQKRLQRWFFSLPLPIRRALGSPTSRWLLLGISCVLLLGFFTLFPGPEDEPAPLPLMTDNTKPSWLDRDGEIAAQDDETPQQNLAWSKSEHSFGSDGLVRVGPEAYGHPVVEMVDRAESAWETEKGQPPMKMSDWLLRYRELCGTKEPPGLYNEWFEEHLSTPPLPPVDMVIFSALPVDSIHQFQQAAEKLPGTFTLDIRDGEATVVISTAEEMGRARMREKTDDVLVQQRADRVLEVVKRFADRLPDMRVTISATNRPRQSIPISTYDMLSRYRALYTKFDPADQALETRTVKPGVSCSRRSLISPDPLAGLTFLYSPHEGLDPCRHTWLRTLEPRYWMSRVLGIPGPMFGFVGGAGSTDVLLPIPIDESEDVKAWWPVVPWETKANKLFWRGSKPLHDTHPLLSLMKDDIVVNNLLVSRGRGFIVQQHRDRPLQGMLDVEFSDEGFDYRDDEKNHKYLLDVDMDGASHRFHDLLLTGGLVFHAGIYSTWAVDNAKPWIHYVPLMPDLSDLPALILFFDTHEDVARRIADAGRLWAENKQRREEIEGAWFTALVEYAKMVVEKPPEPRKNFRG